MFASDSVVNLRCRKRPHIVVHQPTQAGSASGAAGGADSARSPQPNKSVMGPNQQPSSGSSVPPNIALSSSLLLSSTSSLLATGARTATATSTVAPILPIDELRAHAALAAKKTKYREGGTVHCGGHEEEMGFGFGAEVAATRKDKVPSSVVDSPPSSCFRLKNNGFIAPAPVIAQQLPSSPSASRVPFRRSCLSTKSSSDLAAERPPPRGSTTATIPKNKKKRRLPRSVQFDMDRNTVQHIITTPEELALTWLSREESDLVRQQVVESIVAYQVGLVDADHDSLRGLEVHLNPELMQKKIDNCRNYTAVILNQQRFLVSIMGYCNENILSRMSTLLSDEDRQMAIDTAVIDAREASRIHKLIAEDAASTHSRTTGATGESLTSPPSLGKSEEVGSSSSGFCLDRRSHDGATTASLNLPVDFGALQYMLLKAQSS